MARKTTAARSEALLQLLRSDDTSHRERLVELIVDHALRQPLNSLVSVDDLTALVLEAIQEENAARFIETIITPGDARIRAHFAQTKERVGDLLPAGIEAEALRIVRRGERPTGDWIRGAVDLTPIRALLIPIVQDTLLNFAKRLPIPGLNAEAPPAAGKEKSSGLFGAARMVSAAAAGVGKAALGGVTGEIEKKLQALTRDFANQAVGDVRDAIRARLKSDEGRAAVQLVTDRIVTHILSTPVSTILDDSKGVPTGELALLVPRILEHNRTNPNLSKWIEGELRAILSLHGEDSIEALLKEYKLHETLRAQLIRQVATPTKSFVESEGFAGWLHNLCDEAGL